MQPDLDGIEKLIEPVFPQELMELVDIKYLTERGKRILRVYIDKPGGTTLNDCEYMSNRIGSLLDLREQLLSGSYTLEVSSPGLDRILKKEKDFLRFQDHRARILLKDTQNGQRLFQGYLRGFESGSVLLEHGDKILKFALEGIKEARLDPEIDI